MSTVGHFSQDLDELSLPGMDPKNGEPLNVALGKYVKGSDKELKQKLMTDSRREHSLKSATQRRKILTDKDYLSHSAREHNFNDDLRGQVFGIRSDPISDLNTLPSQVTKTSIKANPTASSTPEATEIHDSVFNSLKVLDREGSDNSSPSPNLQRLMNAQALKHRQPRTQEVLDWDSNASLNQTTSTSESLLREWRQQNQKRTQQPRHSQYILNHEEMLQQAIRSERPRKEEFDNIPRSVSNLSGDDVRSQHNATLYLAQEQSFKDSTIEDANTTLFSFLPTSLGVNHKVKQPQIPSLRDEKCALQREIEDQAKTIVALEKELQSSQTCALQNFQRLYQQLCVFINRSNNDGDCSSNSAEDNYSESNDESEGSHDKIVDKSRRPFPSGNLCKIQAKIQHKVDSLSKLLDNIQATTQDRKAEEVKILKQIAEHTKTEAALKRKINTSKSLLKKTNDAKMAQKAQLTSMKEEYSRIESSSENILQKLAIEQNRLLRQESDLNQKTSSFDMLLGQALERERQILAEQQNNLHGKQRVLERLEDDLNKEKEILSKERAKLQAERHEINSSAQALESEKQEFKTSQKDWKAWKDKENEAIQCAKDSQNDLQLTLEKRKKDLEIQKLKWNEQKEQRKMMKDDLDDAYSRLEERKHNLLIAEEDLQCRLQHLNFQIEQNNEKEKSLIRDREMLDKQRCDLEFLRVELENNRKDNEMIHQQDTQKILECVTDLEAQLEVKNEQVRKREDFIRDREAQLLILEEDLKKREKDFADRLHDADLCTKEINHREVLMLEKVDSLTRKLESGDYTLQKLEEKRVLAQILYNNLKAEARAAHERIKKALQDKQSEILVVEEKITEKMRLLNELEMKLSDSAGRHDELEKKSFQEHKDALGRLEELRKQVNSLEMQRKEQDRKIMIFDERIQKRHAEYEALKRDVESGRQNWQEEKRQRLQELEITFAEKRKMYISHLTQLENYTQTRIKHLADQIEKEIQLKASWLDEKLSALEKRKDYFKDLASKFANEKSNLAEQNEAMRLQNTQLEDQMSCLKLSMAEMEGRVKHMNSFIEMLEEQLKDAREQREEINIEFKIEKEKAFCKIESEVSSLKKKLEEDKDMAILECRREFSHRLISLQAELDNHKSTIRSHLEASAQKEAAITEEREITSEKLKNLESELFKLQKERNALVSSAESFNSMKAKWDEKVKSSEAHRELLEEERSSLLKKQLELESKFPLLRQRISEMETQAGNEKKKFLEAQDRINFLEDKVSTLTTQLDENTSKSDLLTNEMKIYQDKFRCLRINAAATVLRLGSKYKKSQTQVRVLYGFRLHVLTKKLIRAQDEINILKESQIEHEKRFNKNLIALQHVHSESLKELNTRLDYKEQELQDKFRQIADANQELTSPRSQLSPPIASSIDALDYNQEKIDQVQLDFLNARRKLEKENAALEAEKERFSEETQAQIAKIELQRTKLLTESRCLSARAAELKEWEETLAESKKQQEKMILQLTQKNSSLSQELLSSRKESREKLDSEREELETLLMHAQHKGKELKEKEIHLNNLEAMLNNKEMEIEGSMRDIKNAQVKIKQLAMQLKEKDDSLKERRNDLDEKFKKCDECEAFLNAWQGELMATAAAIKEKQSNPLRNS